MARPVHVPLLNYVIATVSTHGLEPGRTGSVLTLYFLDVQPEQRDLALLLIELTLIECVVVYKILIH